MDLGLALAGSSGLSALTSLWGANQQANAARQAMSMAQPFLASSGRMLGTYEDAVNRPFQETPGYQFALSEGLRSINQDAASKGLWGSGARARASERYATGLADSTYQNWLAALRGGAGMGMPAMGMIGQAGMNAGTAQGAGIVGAGNALSGGINSLIALKAMGLA